jgi:hypothetical protein
MTRYEVITDHERQKELIGDVMECPAESVMFAQFEDDEFVGFQLLQQALFAEGLWAKDGRVKLPHLVNMLFEYVDSLGVKPDKLLTMTRGDKQGERVGRFAKRMGFEETGWKVYRRVKCQS